MMKMNVDAQCLFEDLLAMTPVLRIDSELWDAQQARLQDYLDMRYSPALVPYTLLLLDGAFQHLRTNWNYYIQEKLILHDQDGFPGGTNKLLMALAHLMAGTHPQAAHQFSGIRPETVAKIAAKIGRSS